MGHVTVLFIMCLELGAKVLNVFVFVDILSLLSENKLKQNATSKLTLSGLKILKQKYQILRSLLFPRCWAGLTTALGISTKLKIYQHNHSTEFVYISLESFCFVLFLFKKSNSI